MIGVLGLLLGGGVVQGQAPPANDAFSEALAIAEAPAALVVSNVAATREAGEPSHAGSPGEASVWFAWTAPANGPVRVDTEGSGLDTLLAVYTGDDLATLVRIGSNDDWTNSVVTSVVSFNASAGVRYWIAVDGFAGDQGRLFLNLWPGPLPPRITSQPGGRMAVVGEAVTLRVTATGATPLSYQWAKDGLELSGANAANLGLANVQPTDSGVYTVSISNAVGSVVSTGAVLWVAPVIITSHPLDLTVASGYPATFTVAAMAGTNPVSFQWRKNGTPIAGETRSSLSLAAAKLADAGLYAVEVSTAADSVLSSNAVFEVVLPYHFTVFAGQSGVLGTNDGTGSSARFAYPHGMAVDGAGNVYVSEVGSYGIRKITPGGDVSTVARLGPARLVYDPFRGGPWGLDVDASGVIYVADTPNHTILRVTPDGVATRLAGEPGRAGYADGTNNVARFNIPSDVGLDPAGNVLVADWQNRRIRRVTPAGAVTTVAGVISRRTEDRWTKARFDLPSGIVVDAVGRVLVTDEQYNAVRELTPEGYVRTLAGRFGGRADGLGDAASFLSPHGGTLDSDGNLYLVEMDGARVRRVTPEGMATTLAGLSRGATRDGVGTVARFSSPRGVAIDREGTLYVADFDAHVICKGVRAPFVFDPLTNATGYVGGAARFVASVDGAGPFQFQWQANGSDLTGATNALLVLQPLRFEDAGSYAVTVQSPQGSLRSSEATLKVTQIVAWGDNRCHQTDTPEIVTNAFAVSAGAERTLLLRKDGTVAAWGCLYPVDLAGLSNLVSMAGGGLLDAALLADGTVVAWGEGAVSPVSLGWSHQVAVSAGFNHGLALGADGVVRGWIHNSWVPLEVPGDLTNALAVAAGGAHSLALREDSTVVAWGDNTYGQSASPSGLSNVVAIAAGAQHSLALRADGTVVAWGRDDAAQATIPAAVTHAVAIAAGESHSAALLHDGAIVMWGDGALGQQERPAGLTQAAAIACGRNHTVALLGAGAPTVVQPVFGSTATIGQTIRLRAQAAGAGPLRYQWQRDGQEVPGATNAMLLLRLTDLSQAGDYRVVVTNDLGVALSEPASVAVQPLVIAVPPASQLVAWGDQASFVVSPVGIGPWRYQWQHEGEALLGATNAELALLHVQPEQAGRYAVLVSNDYGAVRSAEAVLTVTGVVPWGDSSWGMNVVPVTATDVVAVASGWYHNVALRADGTVAGWGNTAVPEGLADVVALASGGGFSLTLRADGSVVAWGDNPYGQTDVPGSLTEVVAIAAGTHHALALRADGTVIGWGLNDYGQSTVPAEATNVLAIAAGHTTSLALTSAGRLVGWGTAGSALPSPSSRIRAIAAGSHHFLALLTDGTVVAWGDNSRGQATVPEGLSNVCRIAAGFTHSLALTDDGRVLTWGSNDWGESRPPAFLEQTVAIAASASHSLALVGRRPPAPMLQGVQVIDGRWEVSVSTLRGQSYQLEYTDSLESPEWRPVSRPPQPGDGTVKSLSDPAEAIGRRFYRVRLP